MIPLPANELPEAVDLRQPGRRAALTVRNAFGVPLEPTTESALRRISGARASFGRHNAHGGKARLSADSGSASIEAVTRSIKEIVPDGRVTAGGEAVCAGTPHGGPARCSTQAIFSAGLATALQGSASRLVSSQVR
jgi:hypothetical protein